MGLNNARNCEMRSCAHYYGVIRTTHSSDNLILVDLIRVL